MLSANLEQTLHRALAYANERRHEYATLEHLLLALSEDSDAVAVLRACGVDLDRLRGDIRDYIDNELSNMITAHVGEANGYAEMDRAARTEVLVRLHTLRQQMPRRDNSRANLALADFIAPDSTGLADYIGAFAVTAGLNEDAVADRFKGANDDYSSILVKALADRLAEAFAERLHQRVRKEFWGYAPDEDLDNAGLIAERYRGIRPAPGYPACPDHTEKRTLFDLLRAEENAGITLTESFAMVPTAAVSGFYFSHPESRYFGIGRIHKDQVADYARRKGMSVTEMERWLAPILDYDPDLGEA